MEFWGWLSGAGPTGLLALAALLVLLGFFPTRRSYLDLRAERDRWRATAMELMEQNRELMATAQVARDVLRRLPPGGDE